MVSKAQSILNARTASAVIARDLGIYNNEGAGFVVGSLPAADQVRLADELMRYVIAHPSLFDADAVAVAHYHLTLPLSGKPLANADASLGDYAEALLDRVVDAGNAVGGIGRGVLNTARLAEWVIPAAGLCVVGILLYSFFVKNSAPKIP